MPAAVTAREEQNEVERAVGAIGLTRLEQPPITMTQHDRIISGLLVAQHLDLGEGGARPVVAVYPGMTLGRIPLCIVDDKGALRNIITRAHDVADGDEIAHERVAVPQNGRKLSQQGCAGRLVSGTGALRQVQHRRSLGDGHVVLPSGIADVELGVERRAATLWLERTKVMMEFAFDDDGGAPIAASRQ
eukprot:740782-Prymnesium_polylepis.1